MIRLFPGIPALPQGRRRVVMVLVAPLLLLEYMVNGATTFARVLVHDYRRCWRAE